MSEARRRTQRCDLSCVKRRVVTCIIIGPPTKWFTLAKRVRSVLLTSRRPSCGPLYFIQPPVKTFGDTVKDRSTELQLFSFCYHLCPLLTGSISFSIQVKIKSLLATLQLTIPAGDSMRQCCLGSWSPYMTAAFDTTSHTNDFSTERPPRLSVQCSKEGTSQL